VSNQLHIRDADLHALIDGELECDQIQRVEAAVEADPALSGRAASYRADKAMLKRVYGPLVDQPIPEQWVSLVRSTVPMRRAANWRLIGAIAAVLLVIVGVGSSYWRLRPTEEKNVVQAALEARQATLPARELISVSNFGVAARNNAVLSSIVASNVKVPDLSRMGYELTEIRLYGKAAELSYRDREHQLFSLYLRHSDGKARFDQFEQNGLRICVWQDDQISTVMAGNVSAPMMQRLASLAYVGLTV
jgi:anti-sigma factor RsiW